MNVAVLTPRNRRQCSARDLARALEYTDFHNFIAVIAKAREACANIRQAASDLLVEINEVVGIGSGA